MKETTRTVSTQHANLASFPVFCIHITTRFATKPPSLLATSPHLTSPRPPRLACVSFLFARGGDLLWQNMRADNSTSNLDDGSSSDDDEETPSHGGVQVIV